ncbi:endonuclease/exonuclease/phosphatase family protein [Demequina sp. TTPB684]|uniref:endonuclease/exonuclease/phosphatase family protein n=1 Tax=unclassified Demequina TaxID=2620311 RepID=UPI001CF458B8|nr:MULTISPECIES: endonuclease/exonuclease/phosphatase family protein [unclassified Demequina]MCB2412965.1 endonuclease/exonuclease/phosphatase family protein [Demequina sp. TTPB684]UPU88347.1 endonuclease/exonuclease/phosphatase family protein [Demequina sp. TMPB413]
MNDTSATPIAADGAPDAPRGSRPLWRRCAWWLALFALVAVLVPAIARLTGWEPGPLAWLVALMPWFTLACVVPLVLAGLARSVTLTVATLAVAALGVAWMAPLYVASPAQGETVLTVATLNLEYGQADADAVVRLVEDRSVDVLAVQELTPGVAADLRAAGLEERMPHAVLAAEPGYTGTGLWSRLPLDNEEIVEELSSQAVAAQVSVSGRPLTVFAIHPEAPALRSHPRWSADMDRLASILRDQNGGVLVAGDFNTTRDHAAFRRLEDLGYHDAADQAGAGFLPTFPAGSTLPPLVAIDHVISRDAGLVAAAADTARVAGTDHLAFIVEYAAT